MTPIGHEIRRAQFRPDGGLSDIVAVVDEPEDAVPVTVLAAFGLAQFAQVADEGAELPLQPAKVVAEEFGIGGIETPLLMKLAGTLEEAVLVSL